MWRRNTLRETRVTLLAALPALPQLVTLDLHTCTLDGDEAAGLATCTRLTSLKIRHNLISSAVFDHFLPLAPTLQHLDLRSNCLTAEAGPSLARFTALRHLDVCSSKLRSGTGCREITFIERTDMRCGILARTHGINGLQLRPIAGGTAALTCLTAPDHAER
jgi:hypothetical protein